MYSLMFVFVVVCSVLVTKFSLSRFNILEAKLCELRDSTSNNSNNFNLEIQKQFNELKNKHEELLKEIGRLKFKNEELSKELKNHLSPMNDPLRDLFSKPRKLSPIPNKDLMPKRKVGRPRKPTEIVA